MASNDIQFKLQKFLEGLESFSEEMHAMYLLAEIRKLIEHERGDLKPEYRNIKFYCDWALHTAKSQSFRGLEATFEEIYQDCKKHIERAPVVIGAQKLVEFLYFEELKKHLFILYDRYQLPKSMLEDNAAWVSFVKRLLEILTDQPITNIPNDHIKAICVIGANDQSAAIRVYFTEPINTRGGEPRYYYQLANAF
jgi:hypothetical protein